MEFVGVVAELWGFSKLMEWYWYGARNKDLSEIKILSAKCLAVAKSTNMTNEEKEKEYMDAMNKLNNLNPTGLFIDQHLETAF